MIVRRVTTWMVLATALTGLVACGGGATTEQVSTAIPITTDSDEARAQFIEGRALVEKLRFTDARPHFERAVALDSEFAWAHLGLANTATTATEFFASLRDAQAHVAAASEGERLQIEAFAAGVAGDPVRQKVLLEQLVAAYPQSERAWMALGARHFGRQEWPEAIAAYRRANTIAPDFSPPYNQLGYALRSTGDLDGAEQAFRTYTELLPDEPNPYDSLAELLMFRGRHDESIASYREALEQDPHFVASYIGIGNNQMMTGVYDDARATFDELAAIARNDGELRQAHTWKAMSYLHQGDHEAAGAEIQARYAIAETTNDRVAMSADLNLEGNILLHAGRLDEAEQRFAESQTIMQLSDATDEVKAATVRTGLFDDGRIFLARGDQARAQAIADDYLAQAAEHGIQFEIWQAHELAGMVALVTRDPAAALAHFEQANPQDARAMLWRAKAMAASGDHAGAVALAAQVAQFNRLSQTWPFVRAEATRMASSG